MEIAKANKLERTKILNKNTSGSILPPHYPTPKR